MDFEYSDKVKGLIEQVRGFMEEHVFPSEDLYHQQLSEDRWSTPPILNALKARAKAQGLWNFFLPLSYGEYSGGGMRAEG